MLVTLRSEIIQFTEAVKKRAKPISESLRPKLNSLDLDNYRDEEPIHLNPEEMVRKKLDILPNV